MRSFNSITSKSWSHSLLRLRFFLLLSLHLLAFISLVGCKSIPKGESKGPAPRFLNMKWEDARGREIKRATIGDTIKILFEAKNLKESEVLRVEVWESDEKNPYDLVAVLYGEVEEEKISIPWPMSYHLQNKNSTSGKQWEIEGFAEPRYHIKVRTLSRQEFSFQENLLVRGKVDSTILNARTKEPLKNTTYSLKFDDGSSVGGDSDENGGVFHRDVVIGTPTLILEDPPEQKE